MATESTSGTMAPCMKANGSKTRSTEEESTFGLMAESIMVNGKTITCTEVASTLGKTEGCTKVTMRMTANMVTEFIPGTTESNTRAGGKMENNMAKEFIEKMAAIAEESGKTVRESNGSMTQSGLILTMFINSHRELTKKVLLNTEKCKFFNTKNSTDKRESYSIFLLYYYFFL